MCIRDRPGVVCGLGRRTIRVYQRLFHRCISSPGSSRVNVVYAVGICPRTGLGVVVYERNPFALDIVGRQSGCGSGDHAGTGRIPTTLVDWLEVVRSVICSVRLEALL